MTSTYSITRDQVIIAALRKLQVIELGSTPDSATVTNAAQALNIMIKAWMTQGIKLWTVQEYIIPLTAAKTSYTIGSSGADIIADKPLKLIQAWMRNVSVTPNIDTPLQVISKQEYNILSSKFSSGMINSVFYDPKLTAGTLYTYLTPDTATATNYDLYFVGQRPIYDILLSTDIPDFPNEWMQALVWGLADELSIEYGCPTSQRQEITLKAERYKGDLVDWDVEPNSTFFQMDSRSTGMRSV
jgi:hypothetical protein